MSRPSCTSTASSLPSRPTSKQGLAQRRACPDGTPDQKTRGLRERAYTRDVDALVLAEGEGEAHTVGPSSRVTIKAGGEDLRALSFWGSGSWSQRLSRSTAALPRGTPQHVLRPERTPDRASRRSNSRGDTGHVHLCPSWRAAHVLEPQRSAGAVLEFQYTLRLGEIHARARGARVQRAAHIRGDRAVASHYDFKLSD